MDAPLPPPLLSAVQRRRQQQPELAQQYHSNDFAYEDLQREAEPLVRRQQELGRQLRLQQQAQQPGVHTGDGAATGPPADTTAGDEARQQRLGAQARRRRRQQQQQQQLQLEGVVLPEPPQGGEHDNGNAWNQVYQVEARTAKFFKERRYLLLEFSALRTHEPQHVVELGCGYGASLLPVLRHNPNARVTATDIAPFCLVQLHEVLAREGIQDHAARVRSFLADSADPHARPQFEGLDADVALIMFTLSAVTPEGQAAMMANAWAALRPGGLLCIRDHGLYDMVQLRIPPEQWVGPGHLYRRGDETLAYFFTTEEMSALAERSGFEVVECSYVTVMNRNGKLGLQLRRVFVHAVLRKHAT